MRKHLPPLRKITGREATRLKRNRTTALLFEGKPVRFYRIAGQTIMTGVTDYSGIKHVYIARLDAKNVFRDFGSALLSKYLGGVYISSIGAGSGKTRLGITRLFINEAFAHAIKMKIDRVTITANNKQLRDYYARLGFRFEDPRFPFNGFLPVKPATRRRNQ